MGNWRTVNIKGSVNKADIPALREACTYDSEAAWRQDDYDDTHTYHCLTLGNGLCGLGDWIREEIEVVGNLAERDYTVSDVAETLSKLVKVAPSLCLVVQCGADWEKLDCVATVRVAHGCVSIEPPEVETIEPISELQVIFKMTRALTRPKRNA